MTLIGLVVVIGLVIAFVYVAQHVPAPWSYLLYAAGAVVLLIALIKILGVDLTLTQVGDLGVSIPAAIT